MYLTDDLCNNKSYTAILNNGSVIDMVNLLSMELNKEDIIYDDKVKMTFGGQGIIRLHDMFLGARAYVVFPMNRKDTEDGIIIEVDEILNKGVRPNNDHTSGILLGKEYVGRKCLLLLQDD